MKNKAERELKQAIENTVKSGKWFWSVTPFFMEERENEIVFQLCYNGELPGYQWEELDFQLGPNWMTCGHRAYYSPKYSDEEVIAWREDKIAEKKAEEVKKAQEKKEYARRCGRISRRFGLPFVNVLRMGDNEEEAKKHQESLKKAVSIIKRMEASEKEDWEHELSCGRARRQAALAHLEVYTGRGDVNHMDFSMLFDAFRA